MSKFGTLLGFRSAAAPANGAPAAAEDEAAPPAPQPRPAEAEPVELDQDLFFPIASQLGEENETVRNLLIDAEHKISELDTIKRSISRLVDPVSRTLRAFEEAKNEKIGLQSQLNNTRLAYNRQRVELAEAEKRAAALDAECARLREHLAMVQKSVAALEAAKADQAAELNSRLAQIADLQRMVQEQTAELQGKREENRRFAERVATLDKRLVTLEAQTTAAQQKLQLTEQEKQAVNQVLEKALAESAQASRKLGETEKALAASQKRLAQIESAFTDVQAERARLAAALDSANDRYRTDMAAQASRLEALQARAAISEKLLEEARQALIARADEIGAFDRRVAEANLARSALETKLQQIEAALAERDARILELEQSRASIAAQNDALKKAIEARDEAYRRIQEKLQAQGDLVQLLEGQLRAAREATELQVEDLNAQLRRERLERTMAEGALEAGRKDIARLLRELAAVQYRPPGAANDAPQAPQQPQPLRMPNAA